MPSLILQILLFQRLIQIALIGPSTIQLFVFSLIKFVKVHRFQIVLRTRKRFTGTHIVILVPLDYSLNHRILQLQLRSTVGARVMLPNRMNRCEHIIELIVVVALFKVLVRVEVGCGREGQRRVGVPMPHHFHGSIDLWIKMLALRIALEYDFEAIGADVAHLLSAAVTVTLQAAVLGSFSVRLQRRPRVGLLLHALCSDGLIQQLLEGLILPSDPDLLHEVGLAAQRHRLAELLLCLLDILLLLISSI